MKNSPHMTAMIFSRDLFSVVNLQFLSCLCTAQKSRYEKALEIADIYDWRLCNFDLNVMIAIKRKKIFPGNDFCSDICYQKNATQWINEVQERSLIQSLRYLRDTSPR